MSNVRMCNLRVCPYCGSEVGLRSYANEHLKTLVIRCNRDGCLTYTRAYRYDCDGLVYFETDGTYQECVDMAVSSWNSGNFHHYAIPNLSSRRRMGAL